MRRPRSALKQRRNAQIAQLKKNARQQKLNSIAANRRAAIARINTTNYANQRDKLNKRLKKARKKLAKATNPVVKQNLRR